MSDDIINNSIMYALLFRIGYLSKIRIKDNKNGTMIDGYQLNEGIGRAYGLKES